VMVPICGRCGHAMQYHRQFRGIVHQLNSSGIAMMENWVCVECGQTVIMSSDYKASHNSHSHVADSHDLNARRFGPMIEFFEYPVGTGEEPSGMVKPVGPKQLDLFYEKEHSDGK